MHRKPCKTTRLLKQSSPVLQLDSASHSNLHLNPTLQAFTAKTTANFHERQGLNPTRDYSRLLKMHHTSQLAEKGANIAVEEGPNPSQNRQLPAIPDLESQIAQAQV